MRQDSEPGVDNPGFDSDLEQEDIGGEDLTPGGRRGDEIKQTLLESSSEEEVIAGAGSKVAYNTKC